jgi:hypothetical protein
VDDPKFSNPVQIRNTLDISVSQPHLRQLIGYQWCAVKIVCWEASKRDDERFGYQWHESSSQWVS